MAATSCTVLSRLARALGRATLLTGLTVALVTPASAQQVVEAGAGSPAADLYYKMQQIEQELMTLRGKVEEQEYQIRKLEKQRLDDYVDFDKRLSKLSGGSSRSSSDFTTSRSPAAATAAVPDAAARSTSRNSGSSTAPAQKGTEQASYSAAYQYVKRQQFDKALPAFQDFVLVYPNGDYAANAHYWLGELYLYDANVDKAIKEFETVVKKFPRHRKAPDALYKLGRAHHKRGDMATAREMLDRVSTDYNGSGSKAVELAKDYLATEMSN